MTTEPMLDHRLRELMAELAAPGDTSPAIDQVLSVTRTLRPEPRWRVLLKERPMRTQSALLAGSPPMRTGLILAVIALLVLLAATVVIGALALRPPTLPPAYGPAGNGLIAYSAGGDIYTANADGSGAAAISTGPDLDREPVFSRDGTRVAFLRSQSSPVPGRLMVANADGTGLHAVGPELARVEAFDWSPDGDRLAVLGRPFGEQGMSILVVDAAGGGSTEPIDLGPLDPSEWLAWLPPTGHELVFRAHPTLGDLAAGLYAVAPDGGTPRTLLEPVEAVPADVAVLASPVLSPDGRYVTFWTWGPNGAGEINGWGHVLDLDAGTERIATTWGGSTSPISPDGRWVIGAGDGRLVIEDLAAPDGTSARPVGPELEMSGLDVAISPDGTMILATEETGTGPARWLIDVATGEATPLGVFPDDPAISWQRIAVP